jgi:hypothetical protein
VWNKPKKKVTRTVIVIKHKKALGDELYLVRGSFFSRMRGLVRDDYNCPRSKHFNLIDKAATAFFTAPTDALPTCGQDPFMLYDVALTGKRKRFDLCVYFVHADERHTLFTNKHCTPLKQHPRMDSLLRKRAEQSRLAEPAKAAAVAA